MADPSLSLEDRVAALESAAAGAVQPSYSPHAGVVVDAAGRISYDFDGHVRAQGVDLDAGTTTAPPQDRRVRWLDVDGLPVADVSAFEVAGNQSLTLETYDDGLSLGNDGRRALLQLSTNGADSGGPAVFVGTRWTPSTRSARVLDIDGNSDFVQAASFEGVGFPVTLRLSPGIESDVFNIGAGAEAQFVDTHNLGWPPYPTGYVYSCFLFDAASSAAHKCSWSVRGWNANQVIFAVQSNFTANVNLQFRYQLAADV